MRARCCAEIPVNCESYNLAFVPEVLDRAGLEVPGTWEQYFATARQVVGRTDGEVQGFAQRGTGAWHTMYTGFAACSSGRTAAATLRTRPLRDRVARLGARQPGTSSPRSATPSPTEWPDQRWYELAMDFGRGRYGLIVDSDHYVAFFEIRDVGARGQDRVRAAADRPAGAAAGCAGRGRGRCFGRARGRGAAWRFVEWATGAEFLRRSTFGEHEPDPAEHLGRRPVSRSPRRGARSTTSRRLLLEEREAAVLVTPAPNYIAIATRWVEALLGALRRSCGESRGHSRPRLRTSMRSCEPAALLRPGTAG